MPRTRSLAWAELKIGVVTLVAVLLTVFMIFLVSGETGFSWERYAVKTRFDNIAGLKPGAPVRVAGVEVGTVVDTPFVGDQVDVVMEVNDEYRSLITTASVASLGSISLLGEAAVDITASAQGMPVPEWGYIRSGRGAGSIGDVTAQATEGIAELTTVLRDIREGRGTIGQLITNDSLYRELDGLVAAAEDVAQNIRSGRGTLGRLLNDPAAARSIESSLQNLQAVTASIRSGEGTIGRLMTDDTLARNLNATTANIDAITGRISRGEGTAGALINERELYDRLNSMASRIDQVVTALQNGEGTAGRLLNDRQLYENMNATMVEFRTLIAAIAKDPRRYLNIRVSLF